MDGGRLVACDFRKTLRCPARGRAEDDLEAEFRVEVRDGAHDGRLAGAGAARDDEHLLRERALYRRSLILGRLAALERAPGEMAEALFRRGAGRSLSPHGGFETRLVARRADERGETAGDLAFRGVERTRVDALALGRSEVLDHVRRFDHHRAAPAQVLENGSEGVGFGLEHLGGRLHQVAVGQKAVALALGELVQDVDGPRREAFGRVNGNSQLLRDSVRALEAHAVNL